jgi:acetyl esterase/lipase
MIRLPWKAAFARLLLGGSAAVGADGPASGPGFPPAAMKSGEKSFTPEPSHDDTLEPAKGGTGISWNWRTFLNVPYKQVGGRQILMDLYMPVGAKSDSAPVLYYVHGGGWVAGGKDKGGLPLMMPVFRRLAEKGFVCASIDYRFAKPNTGVLVRDCVTDAADGLRFLKKHAGRYGIDPNRIVVWGDSAGGQIVQMLTYAKPDHFRGDESLSTYDVRPVAGISWYGPSDFTDVRLFKTDLSDRVPDRFGPRITGTDGGYAAHPDAYREMSSYYWIAQDSPPLLLMQGDRDATIPYAHAVHLKAKADQIGADVRMITVKNAGHNWRSVEGAPTPTLEEIQGITAEFALQIVESERAKTRN